MSGHAVKFDDISTSLQPVAYDITNSNISFQPAWHVKATLKGHPDYSFEIPKITKLSIHQEFERNVCDFINISVLVPISVFRSLELYFRGLKCKLEFYRADPKENIISTMPSFTLEWFAIPLNHGSLYRNANPQQLNESDGNQYDKQQLVEISFSLDNPAATDMRNKKTSGVFRDTNVTEMLYWTSYHFGAKTVDMRPVQNTEVYENFILEPMHYMNDIFDYIQTRYGIYQFGISIYYFGLNEQDGILYIYPPYLYNPPLLEGEPETEIIYLGQRQLQFGVNTSKMYPPGGKKITMNGETKDITGGFKILCSNVGDQFSLSDFGADTHGTISLTFNANRIIDKWRSIEQDNQYRCIPKHKGDVLDGIAKDQDLVGFAASHYNPRYDVSYNNGRVISSALAKVNCDVVTLRWTGAEPWSLRPGRRITFTYGVNTNTYVEQIPGICSEIVYSFTPVKGERPGIDFFECFADIMLKLQRKR